MRVGSVFEISRQGMAENVASMTQAAADIARFGTSPDSDTDLVGDMVSMKVSQRGFEANAKVMMTAEDMEGILLSMM